MSTYADPLINGATPMSAYEGQVRDTLNGHWELRNNRRGLPNWASAALGRTGEVGGNAVRRVTDAVPEAVTEPIRRAGDAVADKAMRPALAAAAALLELVNDWAMELNDPKNVEKLARKRGFDNRGSRGPCVGRRNAVRSSLRPSAAKADISSENAA